MDFTNKINKSGDAMYSIITRVKNTELYIWKLLREKILSVLIIKNLWGDEVIYVKVSIVVIILSYIYTYISNYYIIYLKLTQYSCNYILIKLG